MSLLTNASGHHALTHDDHLRDLGPACRSLLPVEDLSVRTLLRSSGDVPALRAALGARYDLSALEAYLRYREHGIRVRMAGPLAQFTEQASLWPFATRKVLVRWVGEPWIDGAGREPGGIFSKRGDPVFRQIVSPTLREWRACEPDDPEPRLLSCLWDEPDGPVGDQPLGCLRELLVAFPDLAPARRALVRAVVDRVGYAQHELPYGYLGIPDDDLADLAEADLVLSCLPDDAWRRSIMLTLTDLTAIARAATSRTSCGPSRSTAPS